MSLTGQTTMDTTASTRTEHPPTPAVLTVSAHVLKLIQNNERSSSPIMPRVMCAPPSLCRSFLRPLKHLLSSLPPTVQDVDVPPLYREQFILSRYRPVGLSRRCYILSLFQIHNETLNVWSHLLAAVCIFMRFLVFTVLQGGGILGFRLQGPEGQGFSVDASSLPLVLYVLSAITYLSCSAAAHLLQGYSEMTYYSLYFLDHVAMAIYQYSCAMALYLYTSDAAWKQSLMGQIFLPATALLTWFSCATCCYATLHFDRPLHRKLWQVVPVGAASMVVISPVVHRLISYSWANNSALPLHFLQVMLFLLSAFFFSFPVPEHFSPGFYDIVAHSHQLFHIMLSFCILTQQEALFKDFLWRRPALIRELGEHHLLLVCACFLCLTLCCVMTALAMRWRVKAQLQKEQR